MQHRNHASPGRPSEKNTDGASVCESSSHVVQEQTASVSERDTTRANAEALSELTSSATAAFVENVRNA